MKVDWSGEQSTPAGIARVRRPHRKWFSSEEAEAVPAESDCSERKSKH